MALTWLSGLQHHSYSTVLFDVDVGLDLVVDLARPVTRAWPTCRGWMPLLLVTKAERLPATSSGFVPFLSVLTRSCSSSTMLTSFVLVWAA